MRQGSRSGGGAERRMLGAALLVLAFGFPADAGAVDWPWKKKPPDAVTARCAIEPAEVEQGARAPLRATAQASDSRGHPLAYVWSGNGGALSGNGAAVQVDVSKLNPGTYGVTAAVQDAYGHSAGCSAYFQIFAPPDALTLACASEPAVVEPGAAVQVTAHAEDLQRHPLRYRWFANGGVVEGDGPAVALHTAGLPSGVYTITGRVEDGLGKAADCVTTVKVEIPVPPPPPPPPPEPANISQIVFARNQDTLGTEEQRKLDGVIERLSADPGARVSIESYADPTERQPQDLAAARAEAVRQYLLTRGAPLSQIGVVIGLGGRRGGLRNRTLDIIWLPAGVQF